jgi:hypothetical protein
MLTPPSLPESASVCAFNRTHPRRFNAVTAVEDTNTQYDEHRAGNAKDWGECETQSDVFHGGRSLCSLGRWSRMRIERRR